MGRGRRTGVGGSVTLSTFPMTPLGLFGTLARGTSEDCVNLMHLYAVRPGPSIRVVRSKTTGMCGFYQFQVNRSVPDHHAPPSSVFTGFSMVGLAFAALPRMSGVDISIVSRKMGSENGSKAAWTHGTQGQGKIPSDGVDAGLRRGRSVEKTPTTAVGDF